jgi:hypothetical protein
VSSLLSASPLPWGKQPHLPCAPTAMMFCPNTWSKATRGWTLWNCEPKCIFPLSSCFSATRKWFIGYSYAFLVIIQISLIRKKCFTSKLFLIFLSVLLYV